MKTAVPIEVILLRLTMKREIEVALRVVGKSIPNSSTHERKKTHTHTHTQGESKKEKEKHSERERENSVILHG